jgi:hypothetical protein
MSTPPRARSTSDNTKLFSSPKSSLIEKKIGAN